MISWTHKQTNERTNEWSLGQTNKQMNEYIVGWTDKQTNKQMNDQMDRQTNKQTNILMVFYSMTAMHEKETKPGRKVGSNQWIYQEIDRLINTCHWYSTKSIIRDFLRDHSVEIQVTLALMVWDKTIIIYRLSVYPDYHYIQIINISRLSLYPDYQYIQYV